MESVVYWNNAKESEPLQMQTILVLYNDSVWCGVYANKKIALYPEDFGMVKLEDCDLWAALPMIGR